MKRALQRWSAIASLSLLAPAVAAAAENASTFANIVQSRFVHCAFYKAYEVDRTTGDLLLVEGRSDSLTYFQPIGGGRARQISTRMAGSRDVQVIETGKYLHFIDRVAGMYILTTVYGCIDRDKRGVCVTYGARQSRHFDPRVLSDPDAVYESLKGNSDPGFCDYSSIGVQEASRGRR